jgi:hypothetical protein
MKSLLSISTIVFSLTTVLSLIPTIVQANPRATPKAESSEGFIMPSKNIHCRIAEFENKPADNYLRCQGGELKPMPVKPKSCNLDWGRGLVVPKTGKVEVLCAGDIIYSPSLPVLKYGQTWKRDGFTCTSSRNGLTCTNRQNKGFFLNREQWKTF